MSKKRRTDENDSITEGIRSPGILPLLFDYAEKIKFVYGKTKTELAQQIRGRIETDISYRFKDSDLRALHEETLAQSSGDTGTIYVMAQEYVDGHDGDIKEFSSLVANADVLAMKCLAKARKKAHINQKLMAKSIGVSRETISKFENGRGSLTIGQAIGYAAMCGMTIEDAVGTARDDETILLRLYRGASPAARAAIIDAARGVSHALDKSWYHLPGIPKHKVTRFHIENTKWEPIDDVRGEDVCDY